MEKAPDDEDADVDIVGGEDDGCGFGDDVDSAGNTPASSCTTVVSHGFAVQHRRIDG